MVKYMGVISGMATMAMAIPTISFGHRSGHFWPQIRPQMAKISQIYAQLVIWPYLQYPYDYGPAVIFMFYFNTLTICYSKVVSEKAPIQCKTRLDFFALESLESTIEIIKSSNFPSSFVNGNQFCIDNIQCGWSNYIHPVL